MNATLVYGHMDGAEIRLRFPYDEYLLDRVRLLRIRRYDAARKEWLIPLSPDAVDDLLIRVGQERVFLHPDIETRLLPQRLAAQSATLAKEKGDADLGDFTFITEPWPHQRAAVKAGTELDGYALFWEMGTGKTKAAIDIARYRRVHGGILHTLVVAPNEVTYNWKREVALHDRAEAWVLEGSLSDRGRILREDDLPEYVVVNVESVAPLVTELSQHDWGCVIVDESTRIKNPDAQRTKACFEIAKHAESRVILSGTPVVQHLFDLYSQLEFLRPGVFGRFNNFKWRYFMLSYDPQQDRETIVPRRDHLDELLRVVDSLSYRVTKAEVLPDLPEKMPPQFYDAVMSGDQLRAYHRMRTAYFSWLLAQEESGVKVTANMVVTQKLRLAQIAAGFMAHPETGEVLWFKDHAKGKVIDHLVEDLMPQKVVVFAHFRAEIEHYFQRYARYGSSMIYGGMQPKDRDAIVASFQSQDEPRVLVCQEGSGGIGINLTRASVAIYASRSFSLEQWLQSQDRLHRAGQKNPVTLAIIQAHGSVDGDVEEVLSGKADIADLVTRDRAA